MAFSRSSSVAGAGSRARTRMDNPTGCLGQTGYLHVPRLTLHSPRARFRATAHHVCTWDFSPCPGLEYLGKLHVSRLLCSAQLCGHGYLVRGFPVLSSSLLHICPHNRKSCPTEKAPFLDLGGLNFATPPNIHTLSWLWASYYLRLRFCAASLSHQVCFLP